MELLWIIAAWILLNVIVKLFINSIERIFKDRIDQVVKKSPYVLGVALVELFRYLLIILFLPTIVFVMLLPKRSKLRVFMEFIELKEFLFSRKRFYVTMRFAPYVLRHPLIALRGNPPHKNY